MNWRTIASILVPIGEIALATTVGVACYKQGKIDERKKITGNLKDIVIDAQNKEIQKLKRAK